MRKEAGAITSYLFCDLQNNVRISQEKKLVEETGNVT